MHVGVAHAHRESAIVPNPKKPTLMQRIIRSISGD